MKTLVFDIETDAIEASKIWCISTVDTETGDVKSYGPDKLVDGVQFLKSADKFQYLLVKTHKLPQNVWKHHKRQHSVAK